MSEDRYIERSSACKEYSSSSRLNACLIYLEKLPAYID